MTLEKNEKIRCNVAVQWHSSLTAAPYPLNESAAISLTAIACEALCGLPPDASVQTAEIAPETPISESVESWGKSVLLG